MSACLYGSIIVNPQEKSKPPTLTKAGREPYNLGHMLFSIRNLPNLLSVSRILMGPAFLLLFRLPAPWGPVACGAVMAASGATDLLDGSLARRNKTVSLLGKWLDPLSDFAFFLFVYLTFWLAGLMPLAYFVLFLSREFLMYAVIRPLSMVRHLDPAAKLPGKLKTIAQSAASGLVLALLLAVRLGWLPAGLLPAAAWWIMAVPVALSVGSLYWYLRPLLSGAAAAARAAGAAGRRYLAASRIIAVSVLIYFLLQSAFMIGVTWLYRLDWRLAGLFLGIGAVFHILFLLGLLLVRGEFNLEPSGELLRSLNLPLILSFLRFSAVPAGLYLLVTVRAHPELRLLLIVFLGLIFLTDLLDGLFARLLHQTTRIGRILDASGDYLLIVVLSAVFTFNRWIPAWFLVLVLVRLAAQFIGTVALYILRGYSALRLSFLGKASIFAVFCLYGLELLEFLGVPVLGHPTLLRVLEYLAGAILLASLIEKVVFLVRDLQPGREPGS
jgi:CDP-diacylglycerol--glycerol-3-phosphate 3-phosphatidyltransferase